MTRELRRGSGRKTITLKLKDRVAKNGIEDRKQRKRLGTRQTRNNMNIEDGQSKKTYKETKERSERKRAGKEGSRLKNRRRMVEEKKKLRNDNESDSNKNTVKNDTMQI